MNSKLFVLVSVLSLHMALADPPVDISNLPAPVQQTINEWKGQGEVKKVRTLREDGSVRYLVDYKEGGDERQILITPNGSVVNESEAVGESRGKSKGKGKGKAKGHDKDRDKDKDQRDRAVNESEPATAQSAPAAGSGTAARKSAAELKADVDRHTRRINELDSNPAAARAGLKAIAAETGVSLATLQKQFSDQKIGSAGLLIGHEISRATGKPAKTFFAQRAQKREWSQIAAENKVDLASIVPKLERVQKAMAAAAQARK